MHAQVNWNFEGDEEILWSGRPRQGLVVRPNDIFWIPVGLIFTAFIIFWLSGVLSVTAPGASGIVAVFGAIGSLFLALCLYVIVGRFFVDAWVRSRTHYALTNQRILVGRHTRSGLKITAVRLSHRPSIERTQHRNGSGSIILLRGVEPPWNPVQMDIANFYAGFHLPMVAKYEHVQFEQIEGAGQVHRKILQAQSESIAHAGPFEQHLVRRPPSPGQRRSRHYVQPLRSSPDWTLSPGESLLWSGRPSSSLTLRRSDWYWIPASVVGSAITVGFFIGPVVLGGAPWPVAIFGVLFLLYGFQLLIGRFFTDAWLRSRTVYALTDQRVIIGRRKRASLHLHDLPLTHIELRNMTVHERKNGTGTIWFDRNRPFTIGQAEGVPGPGYQAPKLDLIEDVDSVYNQFLAARTNARSR